jgi:hypothetical protein
VKNRVYFFLGISVIIIFTSLILLTGNDVYWYGLTFVLVILQIRLGKDVSGIFPLIAILALTEYYFIFSGKRVYLCELIYYPLLINYFLLSSPNKPLPRLNIIITTLVFIIVVFQGFNFLINSDFTSSFFRVRSFALPLFLVYIVVDRVKQKNDLKKVVKIILFVSLIATAIVYLQFVTGNYYILQRNDALAVDDIDFNDWYLSATEDSFLFNFIGINIKGPIPPVGLNYFKFGYSEKIIVALSLSLALFKFRKSNKRYVYFLFFFLILIATLLTGSRSILLAFLFILLIIHLFYRNKLRWNFMLIIILSFFLVTYLIGPLLSIINLEEFGTLAGRIFYMEDFFSFIAKHPRVLFAGSSPDEFIKVSGANQPPHHFFAFGIIFDGIIVTSILFFCFYKLLKKTRNFRTKDPEILAIGFGLWASLFGYVFIYGQTSYLTWSIPHNMFFCIITGLLIATYKISNRNWPEAELKYSLGNIN